MMSIKLFVSENREIQLTHLGGKNDLCTLYNNNLIGLTDISSGNVLQISISGSAINNTSGTLAVKLVEPLTDGSSKILKRFNILYVVHLLNAHNNVRSMQQF